MCAWGLRINNDTTRDVKRNIAHAANLPPRRASLSILWPRPKHHIYCTFASGVGAFLA